MTPDIGAAPSSCGPRRNPGRPHSRYEITPKKQNRRRQYLRRQNHPFTQTFENLVRSRGLEPPCLAALAPQASASASSATTARNKLYIRTLFSPERNANVNQIRRTPGVMDKCTRMSRSRSPAQGWCENSESNPQTSDTSQ